jgi:phosphoglycerate dehydrogenase-like enzyme
VAAAPGVSVSVATDNDDLAAQIGDADVLCVDRLDAAMLAAARRVRWIHAMTGGVEHLLFPEMRQSPVPLTCLKGCFNIPGAEYALAAMLAFSRRLDYDIRQRPQRKFVESEPSDLSGKTVGIIGLGGMGMEVAKRARCLDMRVIGLSRQPRDTSTSGLFERLLSADQLPQLLAESDFVVVAVPVMPLTRGMIGAAQLRAMKESAYLIDLSGRAAIYDLAALETALREHWIAGASLQIVPASDSPLWDLENLIISYHRATSREQFDRCMDRFCENLRRYRTGQPLLGLVNKESGY